MNAFLKVSPATTARVTFIRESIDASRLAPQAPIEERSPDQLEMKVTETWAERLSAFRLVHQNYCRAGLTADNEMQMRVMKHHLTDTTDVLIAKQYGKVVFTVTLVRDGQYGVPAESLFTAEIGAMRAAGLHVAEVSCVASDCDDDNKKRSFEILVQMISLTIQAARRRGVDRLVLAVHPRHAKVYQRLFGCVPCTDVKQYDAVQGNPAVLCVHDFAELDQRRYPLYDQVYGTTYGPWQLDGARMSQQEKMFFQRALPTHAAELVPMAA